MGKHDDQAAQKQAMQNSQQQQQLQQQAVQRQNSTLNQYGGNVQDSPFYKALLTAGTDRTNNAFNSSQAAMRLRARAAGFGYQQPVEQGAEAGLEAQRDAALSQVPGEAMLEATGPNLQAASMYGQQGSMYGAQGLGYFNTGANLANDAANRRNGLWKALLQSGTSVATAGM